jgi:hypothetical protein
MVEEIDHCLNHPRAHSGGTLAELVDADQHAGANDFFGQGRTDANGVADQKVSLKLASVCGRDPDILQRADTGGQAVDHPVLAHEPVDERSGTRQSSLRLITERDCLTASGYGDNIGWLQRSTIESDWQGLRQCYGPIAVRLVFTLSPTVDNRTTVVELTPNFGRHKNPEPGEGRGIHVLACRTRNPA